MTSTAPAVKHCGEPATRHTHTVLVVDDEARLRAVVVRALRLEGIHADEVEGAAAALAMLGTRSYDLVILDLLMPGRDGFSTLGDIIRCNPEQAVLVLSCLSESSATVRSLNLGAADYLTKPFHVEELLARVHARLRTLDRQGWAATLSSADLTLDLVGHRVDVGSRSIQLTDREFHLLRELLTHPGRTVTKTQLLARVWGFEAQTASNVVDVCVRRLRLRLGGDVIETVRGEGYRVV